MANRIYAALLFLTPSLFLHAQPVPLLSAGSYGVLGGSTVTNTGPTTVIGDLGLSPGSAVTGFPPGSVTGTIHVTDGPAAQAQVDLTTAYGDAAGRTGAVTLTLGDIGGQTLTPGVYTTGSTPSLGITGPLTLDGQGNANAIFIFQIASTLTTASNSTVLLTNGAQAANVFWQVGTSATLGTGSIFNGTILGQSSITLTTGAILNGRALARTGAVTLDTNSISNPGTGGPPPPPPPPVPAPSSMLLLGAGLACTTLYMQRERLLQYLGFR